MFEHRLIGYTQDQLKSMGITAVNPKTQAPSTMTSSNPVPIVTKDTPLPVAPKEQLTLDNSYYGNNVPTNVAPELDARGNTIPWAPTPVPRPPGQTPGMTDDQIRDFNQQNPPTAQGPGPLMIGGQPASPEIRAAHDAEVARKQTELMKQQQIKQEMQKEQQENMAVAAEGLKKAVEERRNDRLLKLGVKEEDFSAVKDILQKGGRIAGEENGQTIFLMPDGSRQALPIPSNTAKNAETVSKTDFAKEVQTAPKPTAPPIVPTETGEPEAPESSAPTANPIVGSAVDQTIASLQALASNMSGIDQQVFSAYLPSILARLQEAQQLKMQSETMDSPEEQAALVNKDPSVTSAESLAARRETQFNTRLAEDKRILEENKRIALEANNLATESLDLDKKIVQARQKEDETRKLAQNVEGEKQLRRALNASGVETSPAAIDYLQGKITEAADSLATMRETNNLTLLKFGVAQSELAIQVSSILNDFDSKRATLNANFDDNIFNLDQFVSGARTSAFAEIKGKLKEMTEKEDALMREAGDKISAAQLKVIEERSLVKKEIRDTQNGLWNRLFQQRAQDGNLNPTLTKKILQEMKAAGIDTSDIDPDSMTLAQLNEVNRNKLAKEKADEDAKGKPLTPAQLKSLTEFDDSLGLLGSVERSILGDFANVGGPLSGRVGSIPGMELFSENAARMREFDAQVTLVKQIIGKALEGGVLRQEDEFKYEKILPNIKDTDRTREFKLNELRKQIKAKRKNLIDNLSLNGMNTSGFDVGDPLEDFEQGNLTDEEADAILEGIETGEPLSGAQSTGFLNSMAAVVQQHEGWFEGSVSQRNNNPGNLRWHKGQKKYGGKPGEKGFTAFPSYEKGLAALKADLRAKITGGSAHIDYKSKPTLLSLISVYAPAGDKNNPSAYTKALVQGLIEAGYPITPDTPLSELSSLVS